MKIERIQIDGFGCHKDLALSFREDLTILCGKNESGKSTVLAFIEAIFYGFDDNDPSGDHTRKYWQPWQGGPFGGSLVFTDSGRRYTVLAAWGVTSEEDHISVIEESSGVKTDLTAYQTVGDSYLKLSRESFQIFVLGIRQPDHNSKAAEVQQLEALTEHAAVCTHCPEHSESTADTRLQHFQAQLTSLRPAGYKVRLQDSLHQQEKIHTSLLKSETESLQLADQLSVQESQRAELSKMETQPQSMEALTMSVTLLEQQKKAGQLYDSVEDLRAQYAQAYELQKHRKLPWTILLIILLVLDALTLTILLLPARWLPDFIPVGNLSTPIYMIACFSAGVLLLLFSLSLILVCTGGKNRLEALGDALEFREQALCDLLGLTDSHREAVDSAMKALDEQCEHATQCLAAIDRDRRDKAELTAKIAAITQKITYSRAHMETLQRMLNTQDSLSDVTQQMDTTRKELGQIDKHEEAITLARTLLHRAHTKQKSDLAPRLSVLAGNLLSSLTSGRYNAMELSRELDPAISNDGMMRSGKCFRGATGEQISLALKLAEIKLFAENGLQLPLLLDEPFASYDEDRRRVTLETLRKFAQENNIQLLLTSCHSGAPYETEYAQYALSI